MKKVSKVILIAYEKDMLNDMVFDNFDKSKVLLPNIEFISPYLIDGKSNRFELMVDKKPQIFNKSDVIHENQFCSRITINLIKHHTYVLLNENGGILKRIHGLRHYEGLLEEIEEINNESNS